MPHDQRFREEAGETAANMGRGLPIHQSPIVQVRNNRGQSVGRSLDHNLEGLVATANDAQQDLCLCGRCTKRLRSAERRVRPQGGAKECGI
jgi:hypothetical protein